MNITTLQTIVVSAAAGLALLGCASTPEPQGLVRDFSTVTTAGDEFSGESLLGHVTIIEFWAVY